MKLDAYVRVSRVGNRGGESFISPEVQRDQIQDWADRNGVLIGEWHTDLDQSGGTFDRPAFNELMQRVETGKTGGVVVARIDRFGRSLLLGAQARQRVEDAGGIFASVAEGFSKTSSERLQHNLIASFAEFQRELIGENWRVARSRATARGVTCGPVSFGYTKNQRGGLVPDRSAEHVKVAFEMRAKRRSLGEIAAYLNEHAKPPRASRWEPSMVRSILKRRVYLGEIVNGDQVVAGAHEPLIDPETWIRAQAGSRPWSSAAKHALSGVIRCAGCRHSLRRRASHRYRCNGEHSSGICSCPVGVDERPLEEYLVGEMLARAEAMPIGQSLVDARLELDAAKLALAMYRDDVDTYTALGHEQWLSGIAPRKEALELAQERYRAAQATDQGFDASVVKEDWEAMSGAEKRSSFLSMIDCVFVRSEAPEDVFICWAGEAPDIMPKRGSGKYVVTPFEW